MITEQVKGKIAFVLSNLDRDPFSKTSGCFDRLFLGVEVKGLP